MTWGAVAVIGSAVIGAVVESQSASKAAKAQKDAAAAGIAEQQSARAAFEAAVQPFTSIGRSAVQPLADLLGIRLENPEVIQLQEELDTIQATIDAGPQFVKKKKKKGGGLFGGLSGGLIGSPLVSAFGSAKAELSKPGFTQLPFDLPGLTAQRDSLQSRINETEEADRIAFEGRRVEGLEQINPLVSFLREEGFRDIQEQAAARGRLGAGGTLQDLTRFNTNLSATVVPQLQQQRFNQLFSLLGLGANAAAGVGTAGLNTATNIAGLLGAGGAAEAQGAVAQGQIATNALGQLVGTFGAAQGGAFNQQQQPALNQQAFNQQGFNQPQQFAGTAQTSFGGFA